MSETGTGHLVTQLDDDERVIEIEIERLRDFKNHPFRIVEDEQMKGLMASIAQYGILSPLIVRPVPEGVYEIVSGHRRKYAAKLLGYRKVPVIIRVLSDDEAVICMVDANLQRETMRPSEKASAIRMKYDAMKRTPGTRPRSRRGYKVYGIRTVQIIGKAFGKSPKQIQRYIRIAELVPELLEKLDNGGIGFNPAYEVSFLKETEQRLLLEAMRFVQAKPSLSQAQRMKKISQEGSLTLQKIKAILTEVKKGEIRRVMFKNEQLYQFFPRDYSPQRMQQEILNILERWKSQSR